MKVLILGGTLFLGRHMVEAALARGHSVTLFNRGQTGPELYPQGEKLIGDRDGNLDALKGRDWDAVIDTCGYVPRVVRQSTELLKDHAGHYTFISSISVYASNDTNGDETRPVIQLEDETSEDMRYYGGLKALCEQVVEADFPGRALNVRAGFIIGPYDRSKRFAYWLKRIPQGGEVLAPGSPTHPVQLVDARDIADWVVARAEDSTGGNFNITGSTLRFEDFLNTIRDVCGSDAHWTWADDRFLRAQDLNPVDSLIYWVPEDYFGLMQYNIDRARAAGFTTRPFAATVRDIWDWSQTAETTQPHISRYNFEQGISRERESELLQAWKSLSV